MNTFSFTVESPDLAQKIHALITGANGAQPVISPPLPTSAMLASSPSPAEVVAPPPGVVSPPTAAPPPAVAPPPTAAAAADDPSDVAPPGWTVDHIKSAAQAFTANPAKGGAAKLQEILTRFVPAGAKPSITKTRKALWPQLYAELTA